MAAGEQTLKIKRGDLEFENGKFVLKKGEKVTLKIELLPGKVQVVQGEKVIGEKVLEPRQRPQGRRVGTIVGWQRDHLRRSATLH